ncbi:MAG TPA: flagellar transcriptional regulator FlhC, partial [Cupriavidus sp.]|nr:flagellar transcriptional regulator FlhC [Cupriavidus sp.]
QTISIEPAAMNRSEDASFRRMGNLKP